MDYNKDGSANITDAIALLLAIRDGNLTPAAEPAVRDTSSLDLETSQQIDSLVNHYIYWFMHYCLFSSAFSIRR